MMRKLVVGLLFACGLSLACSRAKVGESGSAASTGAAPPSVKKGLLIASGLGSIGGLQHTNTVEALRCNYARGFRWFEVDVSTTAEGELVAYHDGDEKPAGLPDRIWKMSITELETKKYADLFPIVRFSTLLREADSLSDTVLVVDADGWPERTEQAVSRALGYGPKHSTRVILQVYREKDLESISALSKELGTGLLLNLRHSTADDAAVGELVRKFPFLAVVTNTFRFTPWLAERLHAAQLPILVQNVNEHRDIVNMTRAGADGFFTDRYLPYESIVASPSVAMECGKTKPTPAQLRSWTERSTKRPPEFRFSSCVKRKSAQLALRDCGEQAALRSNPLAVPPATTVHVELEAEASESAASSWLELGQKQKPKLLLPRETLSLKPNERRTFKYDVEVPLGSLGVEARLGLTSKRDALIVHRFVVFHGELSPDPIVSDAASEQDAGE